ncbi:Uncharacterised protein [uncultured archaeon]|nr:Uncharacterised protein [uncultured archaeon]
MIEKPCKKAQIDVDFLSGFFLFILIVAYIAFSVAHVFPKYIAQSIENDAKLQAWGTSENFMGIVENNRLDASALVNSAYSPIWDTDNGWNKGTHNGTVAAAGNLMKATWAPGEASWNYRKQIVINGSTSGLTDYPVNMAINWTGGMDSAFKDLRFTYYDKTVGLQKEIPYWIENYTASANATVWIKANLTTGNNTVYMYYGNPAALSASDGFSVFSVFDDFNDNSLNPAWAYDI